LAVLMAFCAGASSAQSFGEQQDRAAYAGAYLSLSFGGDNTTYKSPVRYGFSAGLRQRSYSQSGNYFGTQFDRGDAKINMLGNRDWQARMVDLNFSNRGFERFSLAGTSFVQKDAYGQLQYIGGRYSLDGDGKEGSTLRTVGKVILWTGVAVVGAVAIFAIAIDDGTCCY